MINGSNKDFVFSPHVMPLQPRVMIINAGEYKQKTRDQIRSSGYVIDTLEAAMWSVWNTDNFLDAILLAANLADDADSVAATAGQIAGALYGCSGIPKEWKNKLVQYERIATMAGELFDRAPEYIAQKLFIIYGTEGYPCHKSEEKYWLFFYSGKKHG